jgi:hypothetical protein
LFVFSCLPSSGRLFSTVPQDLPPGPVRLIVLVPDEDQTGTHWSAGVAREWLTGLTDSSQDIYTMDDGLPVNAPG